jgi:alcohol dehydrogenase class IV
MSAMVEIIKAVAIKKQEEGSINKQTKSSSEPPISIEVKEEVKPPPTPKPVKKVADVSRRTRHDALIGYF